MRRRFDRVAMSGVPGVDRGDRPDRRAVAAARRRTSVRPAEIAAILDAPPPPRVVLSPTRDAMLLVESRLYPSIEELAEPVLRLAGVRINPRLGASQRLIAYRRPLRPAAGRVPGATDRPAAKARRSIRRSGRMTAGGSPSRAMSPTGSSSGSPTPRPAGPGPSPGVRINDVLVGLGRAGSQAPFAWLRRQSPSARPARPRRAEARRRLPLGHPPAPTCRRPPAAAARCPRSRTCSPARTTRTCSSTSRPASSGGSTPRRARSSGSARRP